MLTEVLRDLNCDRLSPEGLKWIIMHMTCDQPDRYREAMDAMNSHMVQHPESRPRLTVTR